MDQTLLPLAIILFTISTWFVIHHAKRHTSCFIILLSIIAFGLGSAAVALLPIDLSYASSLANTNNNTTTSSSENGVADDDNDNTAQQTTSSSTSSYSSTAVDNNPTYLPWQITYWTTFLLAWIILPITRETLLSGQFTFHQRFKNGCTKSFKSILLMMIAGLLFTIGMAIHLKSFHIVTIVLPVLMALGNTYGLVLVSLLLGNGLINIPKTLWRQACPANELRRVRIMAVGAEEELFESVMILEDVEDRIEEVCAMAVTLGADVTNDGSSSSDDGNRFENEDGTIIRVGTRQQRANRCGAALCFCCCKVDDVTEFHECLEELVRRKQETANLCSERRTRRSGSNNGVRRQSNNIGTTTDDNNNDGENNTGGEVNAMDIKYLVLLSSQLKRAQERVTSAQLHWNHVIEHGRLFSALMDKTTDGSNTLSSDVGGNDVNEGGTAADTNLLSSSSSSNQCCHNVRYAIQRIWVRYLRYPSFRAMAFITAILSIFVLVSEVTLSIPINLSPFSWTLHALDHTKALVHTQFLFQMAALIPLLYMSLCVYTCLFQMSLLGPYCLRGNRQSNGVALVFNAQYLVRLQFPLGYNYLLMLKYDMTHCAFSSIMSDMSTVPFFGTSFSVYAPLLILTVCVFTLCDFYPRILRLFGIEHEDALMLGDEDELDGKVNEGIQLMKRDAERRDNNDGMTTGSPEKQSLNGRLSSGNIIV